MDFYESIGKIAIGSRLRRLSENITESASRIYPLYGIDIQPKWFPVLYVLSREGEMTITGIALVIGQTHPSVSKMVRELVKKGYVSEGGDGNDRRRNLVKLTGEGEAVVKKIEITFDDVGKALEEMMNSTESDLWKAIVEWESLLKGKSFFERVAEKKDEREKNVSNKRKRT